jgi:hypothetical protein
MNMAPDDQKEEMWCDPIVEVVRRIRDEHAARFNYDLDAIAADIKKQERANPDRLVTFPPRLLRSVSGSAESKSV